MLNKTFEVICRYEYPVNDPIEWAFELSNTNPLKHSQIFFRYNEQDQCTYFVTMFKVMNLNN